MSKSISAIWLQIACFITIVFGFFSALASFPPTQGIWLFLFDLLQWPLDGNPAGFDPTAAALNAVLGGVMVGWGTLMLLLVRNLYHDQDKLVRRLVLVGILCWFVVDSVGSFLAGIPGNVVLNVGFLAMFLPPLLVINHDSP